MTLSEFYCDRVMGVIINQYVADIIYERSLPQILSLSSFVTKGLSPFLSSLLSGYWRDFSEAPICTTCRAAHEIKRSIDARDESAAVQDSAQKWSLGCVNLGI